MHLSPNAQAFRSAIGLIEGPASGEDQAGVQPSSFEPDQRAEVVAVVPLVHCLAASRMHPLTVKA
jgi:hypothetical protein